ncbi:hypothetical protein SAMN05216229_101265 [Geopseudomonas sagittaria]|uniref:Mor transcription activator family protein n=2 Tax=Geopseudomonas sagittaria TaxID=1135990 RepID=A0A1I5P0R3_9GAMM|nr:hypothetical protein [Pseudomonas sagittaria]SFP27622.1 hypothetical protein SAMN05216229_101265 [Pseudomonas sagittaria]
MAPSVHVFYPRLVSWSSHRKSAGVRMSKSTERLPLSIRELGEVLGVYGALGLISQLPTVEKRDHRYPGRVRRVPILYVPKSIRPGCKLVAILGQEHAGRLIEKFGGEMLFPASCIGLYKAARKKAVRYVVHDEGAAITEAAALFCMSPSQIKNILEYPPGPWDAWVPDPVAGTTRQG